MTQHRTLKGGSHQRLNNCLAVILNFTRISGGRLFLISYNYLLNYINLRFLIINRGVYLSCLLYHEDKVLVTNEDYLPVVEIDDTYPKEMLNDFHWFYKIAFAWKDLKWFKDDLEKSTNSSISFRIKLIQAVTQMQVSKQSYYVK